MGGLILDVILWYKLFLVLLIVFTAHKKELEATEIMYIILKYST